MLKFDATQTLPSDKSDAQVLRPAAAPLDRGAANFFRDALDCLSVGGRSALAATSPATAPQPAAQTDFAPIGQMKAHEQRIENMMARARRSQDMNLMLRAATEMSDQAVRFDIAAKAIGKGVSAINEITKLN